eukprot:m.41953 g.41953  ORF g.41953 m.41953 type:complete len:131 (-) comp10476_c0_seq1:37-429(-)
MVVPPNNAKWSGGVLSPENGKIYGIPVDYPAVLVIDPSANSVDYTSITVTSGGGSGKWYGGVLGGDNRIYGIPYNNDYILVIDPSTNTADSTTYSVPNRFSRWIGGVVVGNKIFGIPRSVNAVLKISLNC